MVQMATSDVSSWEEKALLANIASFVRFQRLGHSSCFMSIDFSYSHTDASFSIRLVQLNIKLLYLSVSILVNLKLNSQAIELQNKGPFKIN